MVFHYNVVCNIVAISIENFFSFKFIDNSTGSEFRPRKKKNHLVTKLDSELTTLCSIEKMVYTTTMIMTQPLINKHMSGPKIWRNIEY